MHTVSDTAFGHSSAMTVWKAIPPAGVMTEKDAAQQVALVLLTFPCCGGNACGATVSRPILTALPQKMCFCGKVQKSLVRLTSPRCHYITKAVG